MQQSQLNRIMKLIKKTGDKMAILDNETDSALMVMELDAYEKMLEKPDVNERSQVQIETLTEEQLMEKINRDVATWRAYNDKERSEKLVAEEVVEQKPVIKHALSLEEKMPVLAKNPIVSPLPDREIARNESFQEESANDIVSEDEEEKFYLEPVE